MIAESHSNIASDFSTSSQSNIAVNSSETTAFPSEKEHEAKASSDKALDSPPDGGIAAWLQVLGGHFLFFNSWGIVNSFGVYQTYYVTVLPESPSSISWIGTFQGFLVVLVGVLTGPLYDHGHLRALLLVGAFLVVFGIMMTSLGTEYYQLFLAQGLLVGVGAGCLCVPSIAVLSGYFNKKRALATGLTAAGGGIGGIIYPIVFRRLQPTLGFGWATRIIGFVALATLLIPISVARSRLPPPGKARKLFDASAFRDPQFVCFCLGMFCSFAGAYVPFFYVVLYEINALQIDVNLAFYLLSLMNAMSALGRAIPGLLGDTLGSMNVLLFCAISTSSLAFAWVGVHDLAGLVVFVVLYGFFSGALVSLPATVVAGLHPDRSKVGTRLGLSFGFGGLGFLIGSPAAGSLINSSSDGNALRSFLGAQALGGAFVLAAFLSFGAVRFMRWRLDGLGKM